MSEVRFLARGQVRETVTFTTADGKVIRFVGNRPALRRHVIRFLR